MLLEMRRVKTKDKRPFVIINVAATADGKLAPANRHFVPFGSRRDQVHLLELRAEADAVLSGARTLDKGKVTLGPGGVRYQRLRKRNGLAEYNVRVVVSGSGTINPDAEIFKHHFSPIIVLVSERAPKSKLKVLQSLADEIKVCGDREVDFPEALKWLRTQWNIKRLLSEGGGEVNGALFKAGLVDEIHLTLCPIIFGGRQAPTLADGAGIEKLVEAGKFEVASRKRVGDELFLVYRAVGS